MKHFLHIYIYIMTINARRISKNDFIYDCADASRHSKKEAELIPK
jgi:hypothetical protein